MDTSTMRCNLYQEWTVSDDGFRLDLVAQTENFVCVEHGGQPYATRESALAHVRSHHDPAGQAAGNGIPSDVTQVGTHHAVELETPDAE